MRDPSLRNFIRSNPARLALQKAPKAYQIESVKAWTDDELQAIIWVVQQKAESGDIVGKRDYALLLFYLVTGMRRQEVIGLRGGNLKLGIVAVEKLKHLDKDQIRRQHDPLNRTVSSILQSSTALMLSQLLTCGLTKHMCDQYQVPLS
jgi:integrase